MLYFAYGSNMARPRLAARVPIVRALGLGILEAYELKFHKAGTDGSAKCDALYTGHPEHRIEGGVFELESPSLAVLDAIEGVGTGYARKRVEVADPQGRLFDATTYVATHIDAELAPYEWYKHHVYVGALDLGVSPGYLATIETLEAWRDPDRQRHQREMAIHAIPGSD